MATPAVAEDLEQRESLGLVNSADEGRRDDSKAHKSDGADETKETQQSTDSPDKGKELPEPIRHEGDKTMMPGLPPININELTTMLRGPNMPAQRIMKEVADKMILKSEESESDDGSVGSSGGGMGMKGLFDCIVEVTLLQNDSDNSDDEDPDESVPREIPCTFCSKIFGSTMTWKTHVLVAHPQQDPSVLNIKRLVTNEVDKREKGHPAHRKRSKGSSKSDCDTKDIKSRHGSKTDSKVSAEIPQGEENVPLGKRRSSLSRSHQKEASAAKQEHKSQHVAQKTKETSPAEKGDNLSTTVESTEEVESAGVEEVHGASPTTVGTSKPSSQKRKSNIEGDQSHGEVVDLKVSAGPQTSEIKPSEDCPPEKKRKTTSSTAEDSSSPSIVSSSQDLQNVSQSSDPNVSKEESTGGSKRKHSDSPTSGDLKKTRGKRSKAGAEKASSAPTRRSSRRL